MTETERKSATLLALAEIFNFKFSPNIAAIYLSVLEDLSADQINLIVKEGIKANRWKFMPKPGEFFTQGDTAILDDSRDAAHRCWGAIGQYGYVNPDGARQAMGELAWTVVQRMGGWNSVCQVNTEERGMFVAHFRDHAQTLSRKAERNELDVKPALPVPVELKQLASSIGKKFDA